ncbi:sporulation histidine kinase inhibitor Sda [Paenibacillus radicis (ex Gao et al. 2016)]|uniref:sporulation histidine kinase inhibitor Sda n=1 Tax=Paenibacillus radicis (ex Gao et al. 2016) TaxID=1737354 RepID=UPI00166CAD25|nr:sporulation histidine kinase inhibitor Sda [Paenibacillus radicis (ex Gao et al. 2016)]
MGKFQPNQSNWSGMSDENLISCYNEALAAKCDADFIEILLCVMRGRGLKVDYPSEEVK